MLELPSPCNNDLNFPDLQFMLSYFEDIMCNFSEKGGITLMTIDNESTGESSRS